jgi:hypothetical protein
MAENLLTEWSDDVKIPRQDWDRAREKIFGELGFDLESTQRLSMFTPNHQVFEPGGFHNWTRLLPDDAVVRIYSTDVLDDAIFDIATETYENIVATSEREVDSPIVHSDAEISEYIDIEAIDRDPLQAGQTAYLVSQIIGQFSGNVDLSRLDNSLPEPQNTGDAPDYETTVLVHQRNERNFEDIAVFTVENGEEFFGDSFGDSTVMFELMRRANLEPDYVATDVAFNSEGNAWGASSPPENPITIMSTDHRNRVDFGTVSDPQQSFGERWGDLSEMMSALEEGEYFHEYDAGGIAWQLVLGL